MILLLAATGCGGAPPQPESGPDVVATEVAVARAVAATLTAEARAAEPAPTTPAETAGATPVAASATPSPEATVPVPGETPVPSPVPANATPVEQATTAPAAPACSVQTAGLNLRTGPGTAYAPPLAALPLGTQLRPLAFVARGVPSGQWVQVEVRQSGQTGWVSAGQQFLSCNVSLSGLPPGTVPATPVPPTAAPEAPASPTPTPALVADADLPVGGDLGDIEGSLVAPGFAPPLPEPVVFSDRIVFRAVVHDPAAGEADGAGIEEVDFRIYEGEEALEENLVHQRTERTAGYCVFGGGEPDCNVLGLTEGVTWPDGRPIQDGPHTAQVFVRTANPDRVGAFWEFKFVIERP